MSVDKFILGTVQFGLAYGINNLQGKPAKEAVFDILSKAYEQGIRQLDSAEQYGNAHQLIGEYGKECGRSFIINTKFKVDNGTPIKTQLLNSLEQLNHPFVNVYFYHRFHDVVTKPDSLNQLQILKQEKLIRQIGISVYDNLEFESAIQIPEIDVIQIPFNLLDNSARRGNHLRRAKEAGKIIHVRSVFLQGLFMKSTTQLPQKLQPLAGYLNTLNHLANAYGISMQQMALSYVFQQPDIDGILMGVDTASQLEENIAMLQGKISLALVEEINAISVKEEALLYPYNWV